MTVNECIKQHGWNIETNIGIGDKVASVNVGFDNNGREDETQFDITILDSEELQKLFEEFCKEEGCKADSVLYVDVVAAAPTFDELP